MSELQSASGRYGIRLDKVKNAYLTAYTLKDENILIIVQYQNKSDQCGVIRDVVRSHELDSSFVWNCTDPKAPAAMVVGTWPAKHPQTTGSSTEAWRIDVRGLKFSKVNGRVNCRAESYAGSDEGDGLPDWAKKRSAKPHSTQK